MFEVPEPGVPAPVIRVASRWVSAGHPQICECEHSIQVLIPRYLDAVIQGKRRDNTDICCNSGLADSPRLVRIDDSTLIVAAFDKGKEPNGLPDL
jgi:hypothetical protein